MKHRSDDNQFLILDYLRAIPGMSVKSVSQVDGFFDVICGWRGINYLMKIKSAKGKLSPDQKRFHDTWSGQTQ